MCVCVGGGERGGGTMINKAVFVRWYMYMYVE